MKKYCYVKKYYRQARDLTQFLRVSSGVSFVLGLVLIGNAVMPILSYQLSLSPNFRVEEVISPLSLKVSATDLRNNSSLTDKVFGEESELPWTAEIRNWFPDVPPAKVEETEGIVEYRLSIPKLGIEEALVKVEGEDLNKNLVHYPGTAYPGKSGNAIIFGHSVLPQFFNPKIYMTIFSTLPKIKKGNQVLVDYDKVRYTYLVEELKEVQPNDKSILAQRYDNSYLTLVTCTPPGTLLRRLVVRARLTKS
jgi:sortase A